jgi:hypothetical protein
LANAQPASTVQPHTTVQAESLTCTVAPLNEKLEVALANSIFAPLRYESLPVAFNVTSIELSKVHTLLVSTVTITLF